MSKTSPGESGEPLLPRRPYGSSGDELSIIGFGGIVVASMPQQQANDCVRKAVQAGVNYFDVAPTYGDAQARLGPGAGAIPQRRLSCMQDNHARCRRR